MKLNAGDVSLTSTSLTTPEAIGVSEVARDLIPSVRSLIDSASASAGDGACWPSRPWVASQR